MHSDEFACRVAVWVLELATVAPLWRRWHTGHQAPCGPQEHIVKRTRLRGFHKMTYQASNNRAWIKTNAVAVTVKWFHLIRRQHRVHRDRRAHVVMQVSR